MSGDCEMKFMYIYVCIYMYIYIYILALLLVYDFSTTVRFMGCLYLDRVVAYFSFFNVPLILDHIWYPFSLKMAPSQKVFLFFSARNGHAQIGTCLADNFRPLRRLPILRNMGIHWLYPLVNIQKTTWKITIFSW